MKRTFPVNHATFFDGTGFIAVHIDDIEHFRRILCELIGEWVENGEYPKDMKLLERIIKGISYNNAISYFGFELEMM